MFIVACCLWNQGSYDKLTSFRDANGDVCDHYLHFPDLNDPSKTTCVESCPAGYGVSTANGGAACLP